MSATSLNPELVTALKRLRLGGLSVSYTHLDVYKRQSHSSIRSTS